MAGILKPTGVGYESNIIFLDGNLDYKTLTDGTNNTALFNTGKYITFEVRHKVNIWRSGTSNKLNGSLKLSKIGTDTTDVTSLYVKPVTQIDNTKWEKFIENLPIGKYKLEYTTANREDSEWYVEKIMNEKVLIKTEQGQIKRFTTNNQWEVVEGVLADSVDRTYILNNGFDYDLLMKSYNNMIINTRQIDTLETGEKLYLSDEIITAGIIDLDLVDGDNPKIKATINPLIPKDSLSNTDIILYENPDENAVPIFNTVKFSSTVTHDTDISINFDILYNTSEKIKFRTKVNDNPFSSWTIPTYNRMLTTVISAKFLKVGSNDIIIEVTNEAETKTTSNTYKNAIELKNTAPVAIINNDSDNFRLHFIVTDSDIQDKIQYRLLLSNDNNEELVLVPWSLPILAPLEVDYAIDTTNVVIGKNNIITIEYKDNYGTKGRASYTFTGQYRNIMFADENNAYYTTDKGSILKLFKFGNVQAGTTTEPKPIKLLNVSGGPVNNLIIKPLILTQNVSNVKIEISKTSNPFIPMDELNYGDEIVHNESSKIFYIRATSSLFTSGVVNFELDAIASN